MVLLAQGCLLGGGSPEAFSGSDSVVLSLDSIPVEVMHRNPDLQTARWTIESARTRKLQAGRLSNPSLQTIFQDNTRNSERAIGFGLQQAFPVTARLKLEKSVAHHQILEAEAEVASVVRQRTESALELGVHLLGNQLRQVVLDDQIQLADELTSFLKVQSRQGEISPLDATHASLLAGELRQKLRPLRLRSRLLKSELRGLLGLTPAVGLVMDGTLSPMGLPTASEIHFEKLPEMRLLHRKIHTAEETLKLERANRVDDFKLGLVHQWSREEDVPIGIEAERQYGLQLSVPLPFWNRNEGRIGEGLSELSRLESSVEALKIAILNQVDAAYTAMVEHLAAYREITEQLIPGRLAYQEELEASFRQGLISFEALIKARERMLDLRFSEAEALESFHASRVKYLSASGAFSNTQLNENEKKTE